MSSIDELRTHSAILFLKKGFKLSLLGEVRNPSCSHFALVGEPLNASGLTIIDALYESLSNFT